MMEPCGRGKVLNTGRCPVEGVSSPKYNLAPVSKTGGFFTSGEFYALINIRIPQAN